MEKNKINITAALHNNLDSDDVFNDVLVDNYIVIQTNLVSGKIFSL